MSKLIVARLSIDFEEDWGGAFFGANAVVHVQVSWNLSAAIVAPV